MTESVPGDGERPAPEHGLSLLTFFFAMGAGVLLAAGLVWAAAVLGDLALAIALAVAYGVALYLVREIFVMLSEQE